MKTKQILAWGIGVFALVLMTAGASALVTKELLEPNKPVIERAAKAPVGERIAWNDAPARPASAPCNDGNIVGKIVGGVGGGVAGSQIGSGSGQTAATIGGTLGGAYLGGEYIPTHNATCQR